MKKVKIRKKGFTMVELLAVIVILGILSIISIAAIQGVISKARIEYYKTQKNNMVMAAQSYLNTNKNLNPKVSGQVVKISLDTLINNKFIDQVVDYNKKDCKAEESYVQVNKYKDEIYYYSYLVCPDYSDKESSTNKGPDITFTPDSGSKKVKVNISGGEDASLDPKEIPIISYQYEVFSNGISVNKSNVIDVDKKNSLDFNISVKKYMYTDIKIVVSAINLYGISNTSSYSNSSGDDFHDTGEPYCDTRVGDSTVWKSGTRTITVNCKDDESGCKKSSYTKEFKGDMKTGTIDLYDNEGTNGTCDVNVYLDNSYPTLVVKVYKRNSSGNKTGSAIHTITADNSSPSKSLTIDSNTVNGWLNNSKYPYGVYIEASYNDISSIKKLEWKWNDKNLTSSSSNAKTIPDGNVITETPNTESGNYSFSISEEGWRYGVISVTDSVNHTSKIEIIAPIDRTPPTKTTSGESTVWTKDNRTIKITCNDNVSGCDNALGDQVFSSTTTTKSYTLKDKAGNSTNFIVNVYVDKTAPTCGDKDNESTIWTTENRTITVGCKDNNSDCKSATFSKTFNTDTKVGKITISDNVGNTRDCDVNVYVDKSDPICGTASGSSTTWTNSNRKITVPCTDPGGSGCEKTSYSNTYSSNTTTSTITIKDKVGHTTNCSVDVYVDKTAPTCGTPTGTSTTWTNSNRKISVPCTDTGGSACEKSKYEQTFSTSTKTSTITIKDKAGNTRNCSVDVYVDKNAPTCGTITGASKTWTNSNRTVKVKCSDTGGSGCKKNEYSTTFKTTTKTSSITLEDAAGNTKSCSVNVYVDKDKPYAPWISSIDLGSGTTLSNDGCTNYNKYSTSSGSCSYKISFKKGKTFYAAPDYTYSDGGGSGLDYFEVKFSCSGGTGADNYSSWTKTSSLSGFYSGSGASSCTTKGRVVDKAGNTGPVTTWTMYLNRT